MIHPSPLRRATHAIPVAALSLLLLSAGMCQQAEPETASPSAELAAAEQQALEAALAERAAEAAEAERRLEAERAAAAERERELAAREQELREQEERLAAERRAQRERQLAAEQQRLAAERAAAAERERELAERERELREQEEELARREAELAAAEPAVPEPLPEPTGSYEGNFDEPWREGPQSASAGDPAETPPPPVKTATVRAGERLEVQTVDTLTSATARVGDRFSTRLVDDLRDATGAVVVPAGAEVIGRVSEASAYRSGGGPATLAVEFTEIVVSPEQRVGIHASFVELGADKRKNRKKVVAGAVAGAILGHILGGDGSKNVIIGAAAGAAAGGALVARAKDRDAEIPAGQILTLELDEVVTVEVQYGAVAGG